MENKDKLYQEDFVELLNFTDNSEMIFLEGSDPEKEETLLKKLRTPKRKSDEYKERLCQGSKILSDGMDSIRKD